MTATDLNTIRRICAILQIQIDDSVIDGKPQIFAHTSGRDGFEFDSRYEDFEDFVSSIAKWKYDEGYTTASRW